MPATPADDDMDLYTEEEMQIISAVARGNFFTCAFCNLVKPISQQLTDESSGEAICPDCAHDYGRIAR